MAWQREVCFQSSGGHTLGLLRLRLQWFTLALDEIFLDDAGHSVFCNQHALFKTCDTTKLVRNNDAAKTCMYAYSCMDGRVVLQLAHQPKANLPCSPLDHNHQLQLGRGPLGLLAHIEMLPALPSPCLPPTEKVS